MWTFVAALFIAFALLVGAKRWEQPLSTVSEYLMKIVWPVQYAIDLPEQLFSQYKLFFTEQAQVQKENQRLKMQQVHLQAQIQTLRALEAENKELHNLLQSVKKERTHFSEARLIEVGLDPFSQQILINKGKVHGVQLGQAVIDASGLVGLVLAVAEKTARVLLVTDPRFAVPVQSVRSGERAIAAGSGVGGELRLNYVPRTTDFMEGDQLVTSGLGGRFPAGYPVGMITSIQHDASARFTLIAVTPNARLTQLRHVLLVNNEASIPSSQATASSQNVQVQLSKVAEDAG